MIKLVFLAVLAGLLWFPTGALGAVIVTDTYGFGEVAHLGLLVGTYAISFALVLGVAHLIRRHRRAS